MINSGPVVLVVGGRSVLARRLIPELVTRGYQVLATSRAPVESSDSRVQWLQGDPVAEPQDFLATLNDHLRERKLSGVINLLGSWMRGNPRAVLVDTPKWLMPALEPLSHPESPALFISGTAVYGDRPGEILTEDAPLKPDNQLGTWLSEAEEIWRATEHFAPVILRFPHLYGEADDRVLRLMAEGTFFIPGDGENLTHHLHWEDAALAAAAALQVPAGIYHWSDESRTSLGEWCDCITETLGHPPLSRYSYEEALEQGAALVLGPHMNDPSRVKELFAVMAAHVHMDLSHTRDALGLQLRHPDPYPVLRELLSQDQTQPS